MLECSLSLRLLRDPRLALTAACLFCFSPAPATFSSPYNEPFFSAFSYAAMLALEHEAWLGSALLFAAATAFRANGVLHSGFFIFQFVIRRWKVSSFTISFINSHELTKNRDSICPTRSKRQSTVLLSVHLLLSSNDTPTKAFACHGQGDPGVTAPCHSFTLSCKIIIGVSKSSLNFSELSVSF